MIRKLVVAVAFSVAASMSLGPIGSVDAAGGSAAELSMLCANGMRAVVTEVQPQLERAAGRRITMSFGEAGELRRRIEGGEVADVIVLPRVVLDQLPSGKIAPHTMVDLAQSSMGMGIRAGAPRPDISSADALKRALLAAKSIVITDPASGGVSGVHMAEVFQRLGIADELKPKLKLNRGGPNALLITRGEAEMAFQLAHEIRIVPGIEFIPLPSEFERIFVFSGAVGAGAKDAAAKAVLEVLSGPAGVTAIRAKHMDPAARR